jgi:hypothetical protein
MPSKRKKKKKSTVFDLLPKGRFHPGSNGTAWTQKDGKKVDSKNKCRGRYRGEDG